MGRTQKALKSSIFTFIMIALASKQEFIAGANTTSNTTVATAWVGSKYQIECTMCSACDNPCNTPAPPPPSPPPPSHSPSSSSSNCPPPPFPPSSGSNYYSPPPPPPSQSGYPYSSPPPPTPSGTTGSYYPPPYSSYPSGPATPPPNPIVPYFPYYYYSPPPPFKSAAPLNLRISVSFLITIFFSVFMVFLK